MKIYLQGKKKHIFSLKVDKKMKIQKLKGLVLEKENILLEHQILIFENEELENHKNLSDYKIEENSVIYIFHGIKERIKFLLKSLKKEKKLLDYQKQKIAEIEKKMEIVIPEEKEITKNKLEIILSENSKLPKLEKTETHKKQKKAQIENVTKILKENIKNKSLTNSEIIYLSNIIAEEPPRNIQDIIDITKDFFNPLLQNTKIFEIQENIFKKIKELIKIERNYWGAGKLKKPYIMGTIQMISYEEEDRGYKETPFEITQLKYHNKIIDPTAWGKNEKLQKKKEKERKKREQEINRRLLEIEKLAFRLPNLKKEHHKTTDYSLEIKVEKFDLEVGGKVLLEDSKLILSKGRKYGLIGKNGIGKTTLMYKIARKEVEGMNTKPQILMIEQEITGNLKSPLEIILETDNERTELFKEEKEILKNEENLKNLNFEELTKKEKEKIENEKYESAERLKQIYEKLEEIDAYKAESKIFTLLEGLGFSKKMITNSSELLSGGWRMRVALAKVLFCEPDILLLDEPTNHLDLDAVLWLEDYLLNFKSTVLVVSHAKELLNKICTDIILLEDKQLTYFSGGFDEYEAQQNARMSQNAKDFKNQKKQIAHIQNFIDKNRANSKKSGLVQSRLKYLKRLERVERVMEDDPNYNFKFGNPDKLRPPIIRVDEGYFSYVENEELLKNLNFALDMDSKIALLGSNGAGKTTFIKTLTGDLKFQQGNHFSNPKARIALFSQHHVEKLDLSLSPFEQFSILYTSASTTTIRAHLALFGVTGDVALRPIYLLSGGQKSRVSLALAAWGNPHILILDEPTNHLDMEATDALILALNRYKGGLLIVSHDQYFVSNICSEIWYIKSGFLKKYNKDFESYKVDLFANNL